MFRSILFRGAPYLLTLGGGPPRRTSASHKAVHLDSYRQRGREPTGFGVGGIHRPGGHYSERRRRYCRHAVGSRTAPNARLAATPRKKSIAGSAAPRMTAEQLLTADLPSVGATRSAESDMVPDHPHPASPSLEPRTEELGRFFYATLFSQAPEDPGAVPGEHGSAAQPAAARARARRTDGRSARRTAAVPGAARPRPSQVRRVHRALRRRRRGAAGRHQLLRRARPGRRMSSAPGPTPTASPPRRCAPRPRPSTARRLAGPGERAPAYRLGSGADHPADQRADPVPGRPVPERGNPPAAPALGFLSPANAPHDDGVLEFHVRAVNSGCIAAGDGGRPLPRSATPGGSARRWTRCASTRPRSAMSADGRGRHRG